MLVDINENVRRWGILKLTTGKDSSHEINNDSSVGIATGYGLDGRGSISGTDRDFPLVHGV
jgi:hypothetical protein